VSQSERPAGPVAPVDHVREGASAVTVLLDDEHTRIEHFHRGGEGGTLVVTFDPILYDWHRPPFGHEFLRKQALDVVAVRQKQENFYQPLSREAFAAAVEPVTAGYARVVSYGSSLGAYAALYFGRDVPWTVIASSPRNSSNPEFGSKVWQQRVPFQHERFAPDRLPRCEAIILFDPRDAIDRRFMAAEVLPQFPQAQVMRVPFSGHPSNHFLSEIGFIAPFVRSVLADVAAPARPALNRRRHRARSATYCQVLALHCVERGHIAWADALIHRSLAIKPQSMLAMRTLGMVRLAQHDWPQAVQVLQTALAQSPDDPLTQSLLARAIKGEPDPAPPLPPVPAATPAPGLRQRLVGRLRRIFGL
jgi:hypothetical protein